MDSDVDPPQSFTALGAAARKYAAHVFAAASHFYPGSVARAHSFFTLVGQAENPDEPDETPGRSAWAWTRFLAGWSNWRPHRLLPQLLLPPADLLNRYAILCRKAAAERPQPAAQRRKWSLLTRPALQQSPQPRDVLNRSGELLGALAALHSPELQQELDHLAELARELDDAIVSLPQACVPARLARACSALSEWPHEPPVDQVSFLSWLAGVLYFVLDRKFSSTAPALFVGVIREASEELQSEAQLPREISTRLTSLSRGSPIEDWSQCFSMLLANLESRESNPPWKHLLTRLLCLALHELAPDFEPPVDPDSLAVPAEWFKPGRADVRYVVHDSEPGTVVKIEHFALPPKRATVAVSLGPAGESTFAVAAAWDALAGGGLDLDRFRDLLEPALQAAVHRGQAISPELLPQVIDEFTTLLERSDVFVPAWDEFLKRVREWAAVENASVLPEDWTFASSGQAPEPSVGLNVKAVFRRDVPAGRIAKVKSLGLVRPMQTIRTGDVVVSAGVPPHGLAELETAAEVVEGEVGQELRECFRGLRSAGAGGYLPLAATDLFTRFWDHVFPVWSQHDPVAADAFAEKLRAMLQMTFQLESFTPTNYRDYPSGWVFVPPGTRMTTGRVLRVLRPGLAAGDALSVSARVEAE